VRRIVDYILFFDARKQFEHSHQWLYNTVCAKLAVAAPPVVADGNVTTVLHVSCPPFCLCSVAPSTLLGWGIHIVPACAACRQPFSNTRLNKLQRDARAACSSYAAVENSVANEICCAPWRSSSRRRHSRPLSRIENG
jgi:hypothetical protein